MAGKRLEKKKKMKTSDRILILLGAFLLAFILSMMITFWVKESVPDTLIQYTLALAAWRPSCWRASKSLRS